MIATEIGKEKLAVRRFDDALQTAILGMPNGSRPKQMGYYWNDTARGNRVRPLGRFPDAARICIENGAPLYSVIAPLREVEAYLCSLVNYPLPSLADVLVKETQGRSGSERSADAVS